VEPHCGYHHHYWFLFNCSVFPEVSVRLGWVPRRSVKEEPQVPAARFLDAPCHPATSVKGLKEWWQA